MRRVWGIAALLALVTLAIYWHVKQFQFVSYDDHFFVTANRQVLDGLTGNGFRWAFTSINAFWHPLTWLSHMLDVELYGEWAGGHHLTNLFWHLAATELLLWAWYRMTGDVWPSALVAALFALHPLHAESISWVSERKGLLSSFFWIAVVWAYAGYARKPGVVGYLLVTLLFCLGLMSKPTLVTLPCVLLLLDYWPLGRFRPANRELSPAWPAPCRQRAGYWLLLEKIPWFVLVAVASWVAVVAEAETGALTWLPNVSLAARVCNALIVYVLYLGKFCWPVGLMFFYPHPGNEVSRVAALAAGLLLAALLAAVFWQSRRRPYLVVGWLWYLGTLVPVLGLVQVGGHRMADRYTDLPLIGISVMLAWGLAEICRKLPAAAEGVFAAAAVAVLLLAMLSWNQSNAWRDSAALYRHALAVDSDNWVALSNYGLLLDDLKDYGLAMEMHRRAIRVNPDNSAAANNLANALLRDGRVDEAVEVLQSHLARKPNAYKAENTLGVALSRLGRSDEAEQHFQQSLQPGAQVAGMHRNYGIFLAKQRRVDEAIEQFRQAIELEPDSQDDRLNMALTLLSNQRYPEAIEVYADLIQRWPNLAEAYQGRGEALAASGALQQALEDFRRVLKINPRSQAAMLDAAWILATAKDDYLRNGPTAIKLAERACAETQYRAPKALDTLAAAMAEVGRFDRAADLARRALDLARRQPDATLPQQVENRLKLYESGRPYREAAAIRPY